VRTEGHDTAQTQWGTVDLPDRFCARRARARYRRGAIRLPWKGGGQQTRRSKNNAAAALVVPYASRPAIITFTRLRPALRTRAGSAVTIPPTVPSAREEEGRGRSAGEIERDIYHPISDPARMEPQRTNFGKWRAA